MPIAARGDKWLHSFVPYLLYRITNQLNRRIRSRLRSVGINVSRWRVLAVLRAYGQLNLGQVVELTVMEQPSVSRIVAQLEAEGLVTRRVSKKDSRVVFVRLTAAGAAAFTAVYPEAQRHQELALKGFTRKEAEQLATFLRRIEANIDSEC